MGAAIKGALTKDGLSTIAHSLANSSVFVKLAIPHGLSFATADRLSLDVNESRKRNGLPPIEIKGEYCVLCGCIILILNIQALMWVALFISYIVQKPPAGLYS